MILLFDLQILFCDFSQLCFAEYKRVGWEVQLSYDQPKYVCLSLSPLAGWRLAAVERGRPPAHRLGLAQFDEDARRTSRSRVRHVYPSSFLQGSLASLGGESRFSSAAAAAATPPFYTPAQRERETGRERNRLPLHRRAARRRDVSLSFRPNQNVGVKKPPSSQVS